MWNFRIHTSSRQSRGRKEDLPVTQRACDITGCPHSGEYRAPKSRYDLQSYYWFCLDHVREYNANWDFFKGMSRSEIEHHMYKTVVWDRPTWRMTEAGQNEERIKEKIYNHFTKGDSPFGDFDLGGNEEREARIDINTIPHPSIEALSVLDLEPPVEWEEVKTRYKALAKKYHPDTNKGDKNAEEQFKKITLAYTILKLSYQNYTKLDEK